MQKYVGAVVDICGSGRYTNLDATPQFGDFRNIMINRSIISSRPDIVLQCGALKHAQNKCTTSTKTYYEWKALCFTTILWFYSNIESKMELLFGIWKLF
jgi:hypothetical protein